jgi:hypothetical protein
MNATKILRGEFGDRIPIVLTGNSPISLHNTRRTRRRATTVRNSEIGCHFHVPGSWASGQAIDEIAARVKTSTNRRAGVESYLSAGHVENRAEGCALAALSGDVARERSKVRAAFSRALDGLIDVLAQEEPVDAAPARDRAIVGMATRIGALVLARATVDPKLRD